MAAAGLVAAHRQHCGVVVPANASGGCRGFHAVYLLCFSVLEFAFVCLFHSRRMATLGDCPQFVSMVNSAIQVVLSPKTIRNEGMSKLFQKQIFSSLFALIVVHQDLSNSLQTLKDAHVLFSASNDRIAKFSAKEWESWLNAISKVHFCICMFNFFC